MLGDVQTGERVKALVGKRERQDAGWLADVIVQHDVHRANINEDRRRDGRQHANQDRPRPHIDVVCGTGSLDGLECPDVLKKVVGVERMVAGAIMEARIGVFRQEGFTVG